MEFDLKSSYGFCSQCKAQRFLSRTVEDKTSFVMRVFALAAYADDVYDEKRKFQLKSLPANSLCDKLQQRMKVGE